MRVFSCLFKKELKSFFYSPTAYIALFIFWLLSGLNFYWVLMQLSEGERAISVIQLLFCGPLIIFSLPVIVPLITMRLFSEEMKTGTIELLYTSPINTYSIILSKFLSSLIVYLFLWIPIIIQIFLLDALYKDSSINIINFGIIFSSFIGIFFIGIFYVSVGLFFSAFFDNQVISSIFSFGLLFSGLLIFMFLGINTSDMAVRSTGKYFSTFDHLYNFSRGVIDSRVLVFYLSHCIWFLFNSLNVLDWKRC